MENAASAAGGNITAKAAAGTAGKAAAATLSKGALIKIAAVLMAGVIGGGVFLAVNNSGSNHQEVSVASTDEEAESVFAGNDNTAETAYAYEDEDDSDSQYAYESSTGNNNITGEEDEKEIISDAEDTADNQNHSSLLLFLLICYGFNHQLRYNSKGEFNNPFGKDRSSYNANTEKNLRRMHERLMDIELKTGNFRDFDTGFMEAGDFLYADPPYLISCGSYNDGKRGFEGWNSNDDMALLDKLDNLNHRGIKFALSNVIEHKGVKNDILAKWYQDNKYNLHGVNFNYNNSNYHAKNTDKVTKEVLVTNY